ncbi:MAG: Bro-N domain-containing protein [Methanosarcinaceae archaeon]|nr:Bro-N domain-containing protein [Methanosarcinaceae archaeon]
MISKDALVVFEGTQIRRIWYDEQWHFSVVDIVGTLTDSSIIRRYWSDLKIKLNEEGFELYDKIVQLKLSSSYGKNYTTDCANTESMLRVIQSILSKKAEPFKRWLAKVRYERVQEIEDPDLELRSGETVVTQENYLNETENKKRLATNKKSIRSYANLCDLTPEEIKIVEEFSEGK